MSGPTGDQFIRVDMTNLTATTEPFPDEWKLLGGRGLSARILLKECNPKCDPLGPENVLVMAPGVISGTAAPTSGRISIGAKSPLTNGIKEANAGGNPGQDLMKLGYRCVVVKGQPKDRNKRYGLHVTAEGVKRRPGGRLQGPLELRADRAPRHAVPGDRRPSSRSGRPARCMLKGASVACTDAEQSRHPARHAARGGLGAVMGSKGLKYVAVDPGKARVRQPAAAQGIHGALQELHAGLPGRPADVQDGDEHGGRRGEHAQHLPVQEPHRRAVARRRHARRQEHHRELRDARRRHAQLHDGLHREVQQRGARRERQVQDLRARVRDDHDARRQLRHQELGGRRGPRPAVRRGRPRHDRDGRRDRDLHGFGRDGVRRRERREAPAQGDRRGHGARPRRSATARSRSARRPSTTACRS